MADRTGIEWTDATWNPIVGCSLASPGCTHCYAMAQAARIERMQPGSHYAGTTQPSKTGAVWTGRMALAPEHILTQPLRWRRPRRIFVNSMGDLFHESVPDEWIDRVFAVMALTPQHTYQVLTKRSARMREYLADPDVHVRVARVTCDLVFEHQIDVVLLAAASLEPHAPPGTRIHLYLWPLPNVWLGVSTEDQRRADERVPDLLATPAAIRLVSAEPLLGSLDLTRYMWPVHGWWRGPYNSYQEAKAAGADCGLKRQALVGAWCTFLNMVIVGGESGPKARPMHPDWARSLRDQCAAAGTAFFFKQWGEWASTYDRDRDDPDWRTVPKAGDWDQKRWLNLAGGQGFHGDKLHMMRRVGKKAAGRLLDGVEHNAMPEARA